MGKDARNAEALYEKQILKADLRRFVQPFRFLRTHHSQVILPTTIIRRIDAPWKKWT
jgi:hypothetical protein